MFRSSALFLLASVGAAQNTYVQPEGYAGVEGNSSSGIPFSYVSARVQQSDSNRIGLPMAAITSLTLRRDRLVPTTSTARTIDVTVLMGKNDINAFSATFATNWLSPPTTVYTRKPTSLPDITARPTVPPAAFDIQVLFDIPYSYDGIDSLMWEMLVDNGITGTYSMDWVSAATTTTGPTSTQLGTGCTTPNGVMALTTTFSATDTTLNLSFSTLRAPSSVPVILALGTSDPNLPLPGFCTALRTDAIIQAPIGTSSATGALSSVILPIAWHNTLANATLYSQVLALDVSQAGLPIAFSDGRMSTTPPTRGGPAPTGIKRTYSLTSSSAATGSAPSVSAVVTRINY